MIRDIEDKHFNGMLESYSQSIGTALHCIKSRLSVMSIGRRKQRQGKDRTATIISIEKKEIYEGL